jgi:glycosyltransferase involved in cell wall biosynthesis
MTSATIVVPSRGGAARLPILLASFASQTVQDAELIVVLDGDTDGSEQVVARAAVNLPVRSVVFPENRGRAAALNAGFDGAAGEILIRADDDLELEPDFVAHHVRLHVEQPRGVVGMCHDVLPDTPYARAYGREADLAIRQQAAATPPDRAWLWWSGNVSVTADDYRRVGPYDESFRAYGWEDIEWGYRLHASGREVFVAPDFTTLHHGPVVSAEERVLRAFHSGSAYRRFVAKHGVDPYPRPGRPRSVWDAAVRTTSFAAHEPVVTRAGRALDRHLDRLPHWLGHKLTALAIQASADASRRYPQRVRGHL